MTREELFAIAKENGWESGRPMTPAARSRVEGALRAAITERVLAIAPNVASDSGMRPMTVADATAALMDELNMPAEEQQT